MTNDPHRRAALARMLGLGLTLGCAEVLAEPPADWLVTPDEAARLALQAHTPLWTTKVAGAPQIEVLRPMLDAAPLSSPLPIELRFRSSADAAIDVSTFRVFYGAFQLDVTQRLLKSVVVRADGLRVEQAAIPPGSHRLVLQIADDQQRQATRELRFTVRA